jgi:hypothetical protein
MEYLRKFNESKEEGIEVVINNCENILLELDDQDFMTNVIYTNRAYYEGGSVIVLKIRRDINGEYDEKNLFKYSEIEDCVERTIDYLKAETDFRLVKTSIVWLKKNGLGCNNYTGVRCADELRDFMNEKPYSYNDIIRKDRKTVQTIYLTFKKIR